MVESGPKPVGVASVERPAAKPVGVLTVAAAKPVGELTVLMAKPLDADWEQRVRVLALESELAELKRAKRVRR